MPLDKMTERELLVFFRDLALTLYEMMHSVTRIGKSSVLELKNDLLLRSVASDTAETATAMHKQFSKVMQSNTFHDSYLTLEEVQSFIDVGRLAEQSLTKSIPIIAGLANEKQLCKESVLDEALQDKLSAHFALIEGEFSKKLASLTLLLESITKKIAQDNQPRLLH